MTKSSAFQKFLICDEDDVVYTPTRCSDFWMADELDASDCWYSGFYTWDRPEQVTGADVANEFWISDGKRKMLRHG